MRVLCGVLGVLLLLFAVVQYNDPDGLYWGLAYGAGAVLCGLAALSPWRLRAGPGRAAATVALAAAAVGVVVFWPDAERWWSTDVWWPEASGETSREAMGMMVLFAALLAPAAVALRRGSGGPGGAGAPPRRQGENLSDRM